MARLGVAEVGLAVGISADQSDAGMAEADEVAGSELGGTEVVDAERVGTLERVANGEDGLVNLAEPGEFPLFQSYGGGDEGVDPFAEQEVVEDCGAVLG